MRDSDRSSHRERTETNCWRLSERAFGITTSPATGPGAKSQQADRWAFEGVRMWAAVVNRDGEVCASNTSTADATQAWPGSQAIAKSKAYTANAFSLDDLALSTARLYTFTQPGHSLSSLGQSNLFNPKFLASPSGDDGGQGSIVGGLIFFGGGV